jgi:hypothetical protein
VETSLEHADERDLIETFVETKPLALSSSEGDFQLGRISTGDDGAREYNLSVTARMLLIGESRFGVFQSVSCGRNVAFENLCVIENELQAALMNPLLRGLVDLLRPSVHGRASSLRLVAP